MIRIFILLVAMTIPSYAGQGVTCFSDGVGVKKSLRNTNKEKSILRLKDGGVVVTEIYFNSVTQTWTILTPTGLKGVCVVWAGKGAEFPKPHDDEPQL